MLLGLMFVFVCALVVLDQLLKQLIVANFDVCTSAIVRYKTFSIGDFDVFSITHIRNNGAGWSILGGQTVFLVVFTSVVILAIIVYVVVKHKEMCISELLAFSLIVGGGLGNLVDRVRMLVDSDFKGVIDYISFDFIDFPVFNFADMCVVVGGIGICIIYIWQEIKLAKSKKRDTAAADSDGADDK